MAVISRRAVLAGGAGAAGVAALGLASAAVAAPDPLFRAVGPGPAESLTRSRFTPLIGQNFAADNGLAAVLVGIDDLQGAPAGDELRFNLVFESTGHLADGIHTLRHPDTDDAVLFLSAFGDQGARMQAVVNRLA